MNLLSPFSLSQPRGSFQSAVNYAEIIARLVDRGMPTDVAQAATEASGVEVVAFDTDQAVVCGDLRGTTRALGLSLGDRACLALAAARGVPAMTADSAWARLPGVDVRLIR